MRTDLKVNFEALLNLSDHLKKYQDDAEAVEKELNSLNGFLEGQKSKALKKLKDDINEDDSYFVNLIEELKDLRKKINSYVSCMEGYVKAETLGEITRVDTVDIKSNLTSMSRSVTSNNYYFDKTLPGCSYTFTGDKAKQDEQKQKYERNYNKLENFRKTYLEPLNKTLDQGIKDLFKIYDDYLVPFEDEDDKHRKKLNKCYKKYTSAKNKIKNGVKLGLRIGWSFGKNFGLALAAVVLISLLSGTALLIVSLAAVAVYASIAAIPEKYFGDGLLKKIKVSVDDTVNLVKQGPIKVVKVIANNIADTVQTPEGVAGVVGDVAGTIVGGKIAKAIKISKTPVSKTGETNVPVEDAKAPGEVNSEAVDKLKETVDDIKTKTDISDKVSNDRGLNISKKNIDEFIEGNKSFDDVLDDYTKLYADNINSNKAWSWDDTIPGGENLTKKQRSIIKKQAIADGLIPDIKITKVDGMRYGFADFESAGVVKETKYLPESMWKMSDEEQFKWLDEQIGGTVEGYTWHHTEIPGKMQLVPTGIHNITTHNGGRTAGMWADSPR